MTSDLASQDLQKKLIKIGTIVVIAIVVFSVSILSALIIQRVSIFAISGNSMEPTLHDHDSVILKQSDSVIKGEIVFFRKPSVWDEYVDHNVTLVKRIAATPGDTLSFDGESFLVNDQKIYSLADENYECEAGEIGYSHKLTDKQIFVLGDNANHSLDSRRIFCDGNSEDIFVARNNIVDYGQIILIF